MLSSYVIVGFAIIICVQAQVSLSPAHIEKMKLNPHLKFSKQARHPRDVTTESWKKQVGHDNVFGIVSSDESSYDKMGYREKTAGDSQGVLNGETYGSKVVSGGIDHRQH